MRGALLLALALAAPASAFAPNESLRFDAAPAELSADCAQAKGRAESALAGIAALPPTARTFDNTVAALDRAVYRLSDETASDTFLEQVSTSAAVRDAGAACDVLLAQFTVDVYSREDLFRAVRAYADRREALRGEDARLLEKTLLDFRRAGLELAPGDREAARAARRRVAQLETDFSRNVSEAKDSVLLSSAEVDGTPPDVLARLERVGDLYRVGVDFPTYFPVMENDRSPEGRRKLEARFDNRAALANLTVLSEALALRRNAARLLGYRTHAAYAVETAMAKDPKTVAVFLERLRDRLAPVGREELDVLAALKRAMEGRATDGFIHAWDWRFYDALLRRTRYEVDEEKVREYFPADQVFERMLGVYERLFGLKFKEAPGAAKWHPDVRLYSVQEDEGGPAFAYFYADLYAREGKFSAMRAASFQLVTGRALETGRYQKPVSVLVANFQKPAAGRPSLLSRDDVETLFHEFGHVMHQTLTKARYGRFSGSNVARDFVEAPSQMLENWTWDPGVLESLSGHWQDPSRKLPRELIDRMIAARNADVGLLTLRQVFFATLDQAYHGAHPPSNTTKVYAALAPAIALIPPQRGTHPEASFGHLMGGYDGVYYGYLWSKVYAQDMFSVFQAQGVMNPAVGRRYRTEILERGSSRDENESLEAFLGRKPNEDAFYETIGLKR